MSGAETTRPATVLIAALGGEGGGVLTNWIVAAAEIAGLKVQSTSIPGVAQRTGATTYYVEIFPTPLAELGGREPVLSLYPSVGDIDLMVASEIVEAGRAIQGGYISPDRTMLIASTHRIFAIGERGAMADGRIDGEQLVKAAEQRSRETRLADFLTLAKEKGSSLNAVLLGIIAANGVLPVPRDTMEQAIRNSGIAVDANLRGFEAGLSYKNDGPVLPPRDDAKRLRTRTVAGAEDRVRAEFPEALHEVLIQGVRRLAEYQNPAYAGLYLDRARTVAEAAKDDTALVSETARHMALWMSYEDVIRVAQIKAAPDRHARLLAEIRAEPGEPVVVTEFFKPGIEEACSILPGFLARPILHISERRGWLDRAYIGLHIKTTSINGYLRVWLLAKMRPWRRRTYRFKEEQRRIESWLELVRTAAADNPALAMEIAGCARLIKGYGDTYRRGMGNFTRIVEEVIRPSLAGDIPAERRADAVANASVAALADPTGQRLDDVIAAILTPARKQAAE